METNSSSNTSKTDNLSKRNNNGQLISSLAISGIVKHPKSEITDDTKCCFHEFLAVSNNTNVTKPLKDNSNVRKCVLELQFVKKIYGNSIKCTKIMVKVIQTS